VFLLREREFWERWREFLSICLSKVKDFLCARNQNGALSNNEYDGNFNNIVFLERHRKFPHID
jgi:hypothetical protein